MTKKKKASTTPTEKPAIDPALEVRFLRDALKRSQDVEKHLRTMLDREREHTATRDRTIVQISIRLAAYGDPADPRMGFTSTPDPRVSSSEVALAT